MFFIIAEDGEKIFLWKVNMLGHKKWSMKPDRQREVASKWKMCCYAKMGNPLVFESQLSTLPVLQLT